MIVYFWIALICHIAYSENDTNATTMTTTATFTTSGFFTSTSGTQTFMPTAAPIPSPTEHPSAKPTASPTQTAPDGDKSFLVSLSLPVYGITVEFVMTNEAILIRLFKDSAGLGVGDTVIIDSVITITRLTRRRLQETETGVEIEYLVTIDEPEALVVFEKSVDSGSFGSEMQQGLDDNFEGIEVDTENLAYETKVGDPDAFLGVEKDTFGDKVNSPYILLGVVCIVVGTVWLMFLRSSIDTASPTYFTESNAGAGDGAAGDTQANVEMHTIASGSDGD